MHPYNGITGTMARAAFEAAYEPVSLTKHRQADVLMEPVEGDATQVMLYPANGTVAVYPWRSFWRKKEGRARVTAMPKRVHYDYARHEGLTRMMCSPFALEYAVFKGGEPLLSADPQDVTCKRCLRKMQRLGLGGQTHEATP